MIRSEFGVNPYSLEQSEFVKLGQEALYLDDRKQQSLNNLFETKIIPLLQAVFSR